MKLWFAKTTELLKFLRNFDKDLKDKNKRLKILKQYWCQYEMMLFGG